MNEEERLRIAKERIEYVLKTYNVCIMYVIEKGYVLEPVETEFGLFSIELKENLVREI